MCHFLKADLAEFGSTLGFWTTSSIEHPCFLCDANRRELVNLDRWDAVTHPYNLRSFDDYESACDNCEQWRYISRAQHVALRGLLFFDRRRDGRGPTLKADFDDLDLKKGDRLEPWDGSPDVLQFEKLSVFPAQVLFWRSSEEGVTHHRNPLFDRFTGMLPENVIALDWMHTLSLGVFQSWLAHCVHALAKVDVWKTGAADYSSRLTLSIYRFSSDFQFWVRDQNRRFDRNLTEAGALKREFFGSLKKPKCALKAGETNAFLEYVVSILPGHVPSLGDRGPLILRSGQHLLNLLTIIRAHPKKAIAVVCQDFHRSAKAYLRCLADLRIPYKPKDHMLLELAARMPFMGSPQLYGCWHDEALNRLLKEVAGSAHALVHERRVLVGFPRAYDNARSGLTTAKRRRSE